VRATTIAAFLDASPAVARGTSLAVVRSMRSSAAAVLACFLVACDAADPPLAASGSATTVTSATLVAKGSEWYAWTPDATPWGCWYCDRNWEPSSEWVTGPGPLGYGESYLATTLPYGSDPARKTVTAYFRRDFYVEDASRVVQLGLDVMYDDGAVYYVNGYPGTPLGLPSPYPPRETLAAPHEAQNRYRTIDVSALVPRLHDGMNTLAVEVHQADRASSDLVFDAALSARLVPAPAPEPEPTIEGISRGAEWSYWDLGFDPRLDVDYQPLLLRNWQRGRAPLGYGEDYLATTIDYGGDPAHKTTTAYFAKRFEVHDPWFVDRIIAEMMFDDGAVVYLNGHRIAAVSMPTGTTTSATRALDHEARHTYETFDWSDAKPYLTNGPNVIVVEVHQTGPASSDLVFDLSLALPPQPAPRLTRASVWSYWDRGGAPGAVWSTGRAPLGYGEDYLGGETSYGADRAHKIITTYFAGTIHIDDPTLVERLEGELLYDDGALVRVNGHEILRRALRPGTITPTTLASGHEASNTYERFTWDVQPGVLVAGDNQVTVEVHQASASSSDLVFDLALDPVSRPEFTKDAANPLLVRYPSDFQDPVNGWRSGGVSEPHVLRAADGTYVMYFRGDDSRSIYGTTGRATSADGVHWTVDSAPVRAGDHLGGVVSDGTTTYAFWSEYAEPNVFLSRSTDGVHFTRDAEPAIANTLGATVMYDQGQFLAWYHEDNQEPLVLATSTDGHTWTRVGVVTGPAPGAVWRDASGFHGFYRGAPLFELLYATSPDGLTWTSRNLSLRRGEATTDWDGFDVVPGSVLPVDGELWLYYSGYGAGGQGMAIGRAVAADVTASPPSSPTPPR
jgi:hypothetical protein